MAKNKTHNTLTVLAAGVTTSFAITDAVDVYNIKPSGGSVTLLGNVTITSTGTPNIGSTYTILKDNGFTLGANTFTIFGTVLTAAQCLYRQIIFCYYNGTSWDVYVMQDNTTGSDDIDGGDIVDGTVTNTKLAGNIALAKLVALGARGYLLRGGVNGVLEGFNAITAGTFIGGNGTDVVMLTMSGAATLNGSGVLTLSANSVVTTNITDANVTVAKVSADLKADFKTYNVSFESGEQAILKIRCSFPGTISNVYATATKAIAGTDAGTVTLKNNAGTTMTVTTPISFAASDAINTAYSSAVTANNTFIAGDIITITTAKTTAGGKAAVTVEMIRA